MRPRKAEPNLGPFTVNQLAFQPICWSDYLNSLNHFFFLVRVSRPVNISCRTSSRSTAAVDHKSGSSIQANQPSKAVNLDDLKRPRSDGAKRGGRFTSLKKKKKKSFNRITELFHLQRPQSFHSLNKPIKVDIFFRKKIRANGLSGSECQTTSISADWCHLAATFSLVKVTRFG